MVASEAEGRAEALRRIAACRAAQAEELDLGGLQLTALDGELLAALCELGWLRRLFLGPCAEAREKPHLVFIDGEKNTKLCNALGALPGALFDALTRLEQLDLSLNALGGLPASIANLTGLTSLDLGSNSIGAAGAQALAGLRNLTSLDLAGNSIGAAGAQALAGLGNLTSLDLRYNSIGAAGAQALAGLRNLTSLDLRYNSIGAAGAQALAGLRNLTSLDLRNNGIGAAGAQALAGLRNLTSLDLGDNGIGDAGAQALAGLGNLTSLDLRNNGIGAAGAQALAGLRNLTSLDLWYNGIGAAGAQALAGLRNLTSLDLAGNSIGAAGAQALAGLRNLTSLYLGSNSIGAAGAQALAGLGNLTSLDLWYNGIGAAGAQALAGLRNLTSLDLGDNGIGDAGAQALAGLRNLTSLDLGDNGIGAAGAQALAGLRNLTSLDLTGNDIGAAGAQALAGLRNLTSLNLEWNDIGDAGAQALAGLRNLTSLNLGNNGIGAAGAQALAGLGNLTSLDLAGNEIGDLAPLVSLRNLRTIDLSRNRLDHDVPEFWMLPSLQEAILDDASLPGVPAEILSRHERENCLDRLRAHLADLTGDDAPVGDVKLMILGNGRVGKTQICRRLRGESFDESVPSTHGIQVSSVPLAPQADAPVTLKIWDFGGQDIYHGTHALFLKSRAVFPLVWTPTSEAEPFHEHGGFTFRNQPLGYWLAYVRTFGGASSPVLVIQSQCDRPEDERDPLRCCRPARSTAWATRRFSTTAPKAMARIRAVTRRWRKPCAMPCIGCATRKAWPGSAPAAPPSRRRWRRSWRRASGASDIGARVSLILRRPRQRPSRRMVAGLRIAAILRDARPPAGLLRMRAERVRTEIVFWPPRATSTCAPRSSAREKAGSAIRGCCSNICTTAARCSTARACSAIRSFSTRPGRSMPSMRCSTAPRRPSGRSRATGAASGARIWRSWCGGSTACRSRSCS